ncbi:hypothetical protein, partial [Desulfofundulus sp.]|uniref:hypothetical protein n=1 Tax=Desulfofundulus sp. TaxID=2282750 RepID=UPI003C76E203
ARVTGVHPRLVDKYLELAKRAPGGYLSRLKVSLGLLSDPHEEEDPAARLFHVLQTEHNFSPAKARAFLRLLENHLEEYRETVLPAAWCTTPSPTRSHRANRWTNAGWYPST